jgi:hypothetical protein
LGCNIGYENGNVVNIKLNIFEKGCRTVICNLPRKCHEQGQAFTKKKKVDGNGRNTFLRIFSGKINVMKKKM